MCSHLVRALLSASSGKAHLWCSHGLWHCAWRGASGLGYTPTDAWGDACRRLRVPTLTDVVS